MRICTYHRVSTVDQNAELARDDLAARAIALHGAPLPMLAHKIEETGSGAKNNRPGLQKVLDLARKGAIDCVLVWKLDRFGRSALDLLANLRTLEDHGVRFVSVTQGIDIKPGGDPMSHLLVTMLAAIAEFERDLITERTRLGLAHARTEGRIGGRRRVLAINAAEVKRLRDMGTSWKKIAGFLGCSSAAARRAVGETE